MNKFMTMMGNLTAMFLRVTEADFALVALIVLVYILLGEDAGPYVISVVTNLTLLVGAVTPRRLSGSRLCWGWSICSRRAVGQAESRK